MTSKVYSNYTESGSPWLGQIPSHWSVKKLKFLAVVQPSNVDKKAIDGEEPVLLCNYTDVYKNEYIGSRLEFMSATATSTEIEKFSTDIGDVIVTKDSEDPSDIAIPACISEKIDGLLCGYHLTQIKPIDLDGRYLLRLFQSKGFNAQFIISANGVTRFGLPQHAISNAYSCIPPMPEQKGIANFLDFKTAQIDALISQQKDLLDKLAEKRTALISHAVTKGLDPSVKMKDSGVEWLGEIPKHWTMTRLRFVTTCIEQGWSPQCNNQPASEEQWGVLKVGCVNSESFDENENKSLPDNLEPRLQYEVKSGDILVSRANTKALLGSAALINQVRPRLLLCDKLYRIKPNSLVEAGYLVRFMRSTIARFQYEKNATGTSGSMQNIGQDTLKDLPIPLPPKDEQVAILKYLESKSTTIKLSEEKIASVIAKLTEYRVSLITNAVTGKIDVRDFPIPEQGESQQTECA
ncbi:restriction endonuclease subunit S [Pectobacterium sp. CHL-2024]|uniref:restriction endonuclease subunit S n=1 Tax=Pectobacterium sp. CHL-2024 TaxID=3377079 RepID=UPI003805E0F7